MHATSQNVLSKFVKKIQSFAFPLVSNKRAYDLTRACNDPPEAIVKLVINLQSITDSRRANLFAYANMLSLGGQISEAMCSNYSLWSTVVYMPANTILWNNDGLMCRWMRRHGKHKFFSCRLICGLCVTGIWCLMFISNSGRGQSLILLGAENPFVELI